MNSSETIEAKKKKSFWSSTHGAIVKFAAFLTALVTIIKFFSPAYTYMREKFFSSELKDTIATSKIKPIINDYYLLDDKENFDELAALFSNSVRNYYGEYNITHQQIIQNAISYHTRWHYRNYSIDFPSLTITQENNEYIISYKIFYQTKKVVTDNWKTFNLIIHMTMDTNLKITSVYEERIK